MSSDLEKKLAGLQEQFSYAAHVKFFMKDELIGIHVDNAMASASILLQGAQLIQFTPNNKPRLVWHSSAVTYKKGKPLRGGIPVCWPWFGPLSSNNKNIQALCPDDAPPAHGFARNQDWQLESIQNLTTGATKLRFSLSDNETTRRYFLRKFCLQLEFTIGTELYVSLHIQNKDEDVLYCSGALHTYFAIYDINKTRVYGLDGLSYVDSTAEGKVLQQQGPVEINSETDRIYFVEGKNSLADNDCSEQHIKCTDRKIKIRSRGSSSVVVWNPWIEKSRALSTFNDDEYLEMLCIETAKAHTDYVQLAPGATHIVSVSLGYQ